MRPPFGEEPDSADDLDDGRPSEGTVDKSRHMAETGRKWPIGLFGLVSLFAIWDILVRSGLVSAIYLPLPGTVLFRMLELLLSGVILKHMLASLTNLAIGVVAGNAIALALALLCVGNRTFRLAIAPVVEFVRGLAPIALLPAFLLIFGIGIRAEVAIIVWVAWVPVFLNVLEGADGIDRWWVIAARSMGASPAKVVVSVIWPALLPFYFTGLRLSIGAAFLSLVAAEMIGTNAGLGYFILEASQTFHLVDMYAAIALIGLLGIGLNTLLASGAQHLMSWRD